MAKRCDICGKKPVYGHRKKHKHSKAWRYRAPKTNRVWIPNLREVTLETPLGGAKVKMCMSCYRRYRKEAEVFLKRKNRKLYRKLFVKPLL